MGLPGKPAGHGACMTCFVASVPMSRRKSPRPSHPRGRLEPMFGPAGPVLGIDPGVSRCGYGAVAGVGAALEAVACGVIRTPPHQPLPERLAELQGELEALVAEIRP